MLCRHLATRSGITACEDENRKKVVILPKFLKIVIRFFRKLPCGSKFATGQRSACRKFNKNVKNSFI